MVVRRVAIQEAIPRIASARDRLLRSRRPSLGCQLTGADILTLLRGAIWTKRSETAEFPQVEGQQKQ